MINSVLILSFLIPIAYTATLNVHIDEPAHNISPELFGIFLEEINHGVDGGTEDISGSKNYTKKMFFLRSSC